jgi:hypothetical protein
MAVVGKRKWWALVALALSVLVVGLDLTVLNVALASRHSVPATSRGPPHAYDQHQHPQRPLFCGRFVVSSPCRASPRRYAGRCPVITLLVAVGVASVLLGVALVLISRRLP